MTLDVTYNNISNLHSDPIKAGLQTIQLCKSVAQNQVRKYKNLCFFVMS